MIFLAAGEPTSESITSPAFLLNLGAVGFFLFMFMRDKITTKTAADSREELYKQAALLQEKHIERLINERDRAYAERDEAYDVMKHLTEKVGDSLPRNPRRRKPDET